MQLPVQITFRNMGPSAAVEAAIRRRVSRLDHFYPRIMGCRVVVDAPHRHQHKGKLFRVRVDLTVPEGELVVAREAGRAGEHEDVYVAIRDAFDAARRELMDHARRLRGDIKSHPRSPAGTGTGPPA